MEGAETEQPVRFQSVAEEFSVRGRWDAGKGHRQPEPVRPPYPEHCRTPAGVPVSAGNACRPPYFRRQSLEFRPAGRASDQPSAGALVRNGDGEGLCDFPPSNPLRRSPFPAQFSGIRSEK